MQTMTQTRPTLPQIRGLARFACRAGVKYSQTGAWLESTLGRYLTTFERSMGLMAWAEEREQMAD